MARQILGSSPGDYAIIPPEWPKWPEEGEAGMLKTRVISAVVLVPLCLAGLFISPITTAILTAIAAVIGTYEFINMASNSRFRFRPLLIPGLVLAASFSLSAFLKRVELIPLAIILLIFYSLLALIARHALEPSLDQGRNGFLANWGLTNFAPIYVGLPLGLVALIRSRFEGTNEAYWWILLALLATWGTDTAAYFVGRAIGRHKLAPKISPKKTIEGAAGGIFVGTLAVMLVGGLGLGLPGFLTFPLGLVLTVASILGDLFESWTKRRFDIKDSGKIIPGHGGLLDRIDSLLPVALLVYLFIFFY